MDVCAYLLQTSCSSACSLAFSLMDECFCSCAILSRNFYYQSRKESKPSIVTSSGKRPERNEMKRIDQWQQRNQRVVYFLRGIEAILLMPQSPSGFPVFLFILM